MNASEEEAVVRLEHQLLAPNIGAPRWQRTTAVPGLSLFVSASTVVSDRARPLQPNTGALLGTVFSRSASTASGRASAQVEFNSEQSARVLNSHGQWLINDCWGDYVAIFRNESDVVELVRAPAGRLPCFRLVFEGVHIIFSKALDVLELGNREFSVNWDCVLDLLINDAQIENTALNEVTQVRPGYRVSFAPSKAPIECACWTPGLESCESLEVPENAAQHLHDVVKSCIHSWSTVSKGVVVRLSGGIDSSIVAGCLRDAPGPPHVICLNSYAHGSGADERPYARAVAAHSNFELVESLRPSAISLARLFDAEPVPIPDLALGALLHSEVERELVLSRGATAIYGGDGGDEIFGRSLTRMVATDFAFNHGVRPALMRIAIQAARAEGLSIWKILKEAFRDGQLARWDIFDHFEREGGLPLMSVEATKDLRNSDALSTWRSLTTRRACPGKVLQAFLVSVRLPYYDAYQSATAPEYVFPLLSQPIIEAALQIPTYTHFFDGRERGLARMAFRHRLPAEVANRFSKGLVDSDAAEIMRANIGFFRDVLGGGELVRRGILDSKHLDRALSNIPTGVIRGHAHLFTALSVEIWLQTWKSQLRPRRISTAAA